jgi:uncharacterized protein YjiS (DUF1127 family)
MEMIMSAPSRATLPRTNDGFPRRAGRTLQRWWLAYMDWRIRRLTLERLSFMSDRQLEDLGLSRSEIEFAIGRQAEQRPMPQSRFY